MQELRKKTLSRMQEEDYFDDYGDDNFVPDKSKRYRDKLGDDLEELALGSNDVVCGRRYRNANVPRISMNPTELRGVQMDFMYAIAMRALILRPCFLCA